MFGIPNDVAMQVVAVGFIIGVLQDSAETALNSSTDILFTAAVCQAEERREAAKISANAKIKVPRQIDAGYEVRKNVSLIGQYARCGRAGDLRVAFLAYSVTPLLKIASSRKSLRSLLVSLPFATSTM